MEKERRQAASEWLHRHGDRGKWLVLLLGRHRSELVLSELGRKMEGMDYAAVSDGVRRFERKLLKDPKGKRELAAVKRRLDIE